MYKSPEPAARIGVNPPMSAAPIPCEITNALMLRARVGLRVWHHERAGSACCVRRAPNSPACGSGACASSAGMKWCCSRCDYRGDARAQARKPHGVSICAASIATRQERMRAIAQQRIATGRYERPPCRFSGIKVALQSARISALPTVCPLCDYAVLSRRNSGKDRRRRVERAALLISHPYKIIFMRGESKRATHARLFPVFNQNFRPEWSCD